MGPKTFTTMFQYLAAVAVVSSLLMFGSSHGSPVGRERTNRRGLDLEAHHTNDDNSYGVEGSEVSTTDYSKKNPFLRSKREASGESCTIPANLPATVQELNGFLNGSQYVSFISEQDGFIPIPRDQPHACPSSSDAWWPKDEVNLRSTCPFIKEELDNGPDAYPRHLIQAKCLCTNCVGSDVYTCQEIRHDVTIFRKRGCQNGLALMEKDVVTVTLGCFCAAPAPNPGSGSSGSGSSGLPVTS